MRRGGIPEGIKQFHTYSQEDPIDEWYGLGDPSDRRAWYIFSEQGKEQYRGADKFRGNISESEGSHTDLNTSSDPMAFFEGAMSANPFPWNPSRPKYASCFFVLRTYDHTRFLCAWKQLLHVCTKFLTAVTTEVVGVGPRAVGREA